LLAEHKSRGENLDKATSQAFEYLENTPENELPKFVIISDFARIRLYDLEGSAEYSFAIEELPSKIHHADRGKRRAGPNAVVARTRNKFVRVRADVGE